MRQIRRFIRIRPLDPIISRDGRPFDLTPGVVAHTMQDLSPSMVAGTLRTLIGKKVAEQTGKHPESLFRSKHLEHIKRSVVRGPIYARENTKFFPLPQDMYIYTSSDSTNSGQKEEIKLAFCVPDSSVRGGFLGTGIQGMYEDLLIPAFVPSNTKAINDPPAYMSESMMEKWLLSSTTPSLLKEIERELQQWRTENDRTHFLAPFPKDIRHHIELDTSTGVSSDTDLFTTEAIRLPDDISVLAQVEWEDSNPDSLFEISSIHSMGGKRRLAHFQEIKDQQLLECPPTIIEKLHDAKYIRLILATPAYFSKGWKPGWLDENLKTTWDRPVQLQLCWANIPGWVPYSGWSYKERKEKAIRRMVPAGSVYFFKVLEGNASELAQETWLQSVSDRNRSKFARDREDGFGLALWGLWKNGNGKEGES